MSTRGAYGFRFNNKDLLTYNHSDSYPEWLGREMLYFILLAKNDERLLEIAKNLKPVPADGHATPEQVEELKQFADLGVSTKDITEWYVLLRKLQGSPEMWLEGVNYITDDSSFVKDSLFCEWAYIINLDENILEVYKGFNKNPKAPGRYAAFRSDSHEEYYGVALLKTIKLDDIRKWTPEQFDLELAKLDVSDDEE